MAWLLGYIWADGDIKIDRGYYLRVGCTIGDRELVDLVYKMLDCHQKVYVNKGRSCSQYVGKPSVRLTMGSKSMVKV